MSSNNRVSPTLGNQESAPRPTTSAVNNNSSTKDSGGGAPMTFKSVYAKKSTILFVLVLGLVMAVGGSLLTWWGTRSEVSDLLIIGPGLLVIGFFFIVCAVVLAAMAAGIKLPERCRKRPKKLTPSDSNNKSSKKLSQQTAAPQTDQNQHNITKNNNTSLYETYDAPDTLQIVKSRPPSTDLLYGSELNRAMKVTTLTRMMSDKNLTSGVAAGINNSNNSPNKVKDSAVIPQTEVAAVPKVALPNKAQETRVRAPSAPTYQVTMTPTRSANNGSRIGLDVFEDEKDSDSDVVTAVAENKPTQNDTTTVDVDGSTQQNESST